MGCLEENTIAAFAEARLAPESMVEVEAHAHQCTGCHDLIVAALHLSGLARTAVTEQLRPTPAGPRASTERIGPARSGRRALPETVAAGTSIGRFTVLGLVGRGGMGEVYAAYDPSLDRRVALKLMLPDGGASAENGEARMLREAQAIAQLSHPNVVVVYEVGTFERRVFIAMEFIEGVTLAEWLTNRRRSWREILEVYLQAARGLAAAHRAGLVHRDFKPQNVMVARDGSVRVMDFGLARRVGAVELAEGELHLERGRCTASVTDVVGTLDYHDNLKLCFNAR